ncbi:MAG: DUF3261 domain-containing protein [Pseudomonadota bacterium]
MSITENVWYCFAPDAAPLQPGLQMVHVKGVGFEERMIFQMESKDTTVSMAVVSPIGQPVLSLEWNGKLLTSQSILGDIVTRHSRRLFMFVQWLKWPEEQMLKGFRGGFVHWHHEQSLHIRRLIVEDRTLLEEKIKEDGEHVITLPGFGITVSIKDLAE